MKPEQERVKHLLTDTVSLLCKNGLQFTKEMKVQGLLGVTLDENEVFLVHINETFVAMVDHVNNLNPESSSLGSEEALGSIVTSAAGNNGQLKLGLEHEISKMFNNSIDVRPLKSSLRPVRSHSRYGKKRVPKDPLRPRKGGTSQHRFMSGIQYQQQRQQLAQNEFQQRSAYLESSGVSLSLNPVTENANTNEVCIKKEDGIALLNKKQANDELAERRTLFDAYIADSTLAEVSLAQNLLMGFTAGKTLPIENNPVIPILSQSIMTPEIPTSEGPFVSGIAQSYQGAAATNDSSPSSLGSTGWDMSPGGSQHVSAGGSFSEAAGKRRFQSGAERAKDYRIRKKMSEGSAFLERQRLAMRNYRARKRQEVGDQEYKRMQRDRARERRNRRKDSVPGGGMGNSLVMGQLFTPDLSSSSGDLRDKWEEPSMFAYNDGGTMWDVAKMTGCDVSSQFFDKDKSCT